MDSLLAVFPELYDAFKMFDKDMDGRIQASELGSVMRMLGRPFSSDDLSRMIQNAAPQGKLSFFSSFFLTQKI